MRPVYRRTNVEKSVPRGNRRPQEKQHDKSEVLYDHVWFDGSEQMTLAAEMELSRYGYHVLDDFHKLIYAKSPLKVCVFSDHRGTKETMKEFQDELSNLNGYVCGEHYLVIRLCNWGTQKIEAFSACPASGSRAEFLLVFSAPWKR